ncbi:MAG TPA: cytochrome c [Polyangiaceae bacterium]|nr:cytochrome c [Polyangiaceae bacterium]
MGARSWFWLPLLLLAAMQVGACARRAPQQQRTKPAPSAPPTTAPTPSDLVTVSHGDAARGRELVEHFECNRCHEGTGLGSAPLSKNCFSCHEQIITGKFPVSAAALARFRPHVQSAREAPSLTALGARLEPSWVVEYLLAPHDLRPKLTPTMPRLPLDRAQAQDIAAYLSASTVPKPALAVAAGNSRRGRALMEQKGCASCHAFSGVPPFTASAPPAGSEAERAAALAPDLRFTRDRFRADQLLGFLLDPKAIKPDTRMPSFGLSRDEAADLAAYVREAPLTFDPGAPFVRLPILSRRVSFEEANRQVFSRTCHHCHTDAQSAGGDGGPGNTGGFGFTPRGISFSSHASILAGYVDEQGQRRSLFEPLADGTPRLVAALLARHDEARSVARDNVRGMPLALPPLSAEDIQVVESWVAQGKPL